MNKAVPKKNGKGSLCNFTISISINELRELGLEPSLESQVFFKKIVDAEKGAIILELQKEEL